MVGRMKKAEASGAGTSSARDLSACADARHNTTGNRRFKHRRIKIPASGCSRVWVRERV